MFLGSRAFLVRKTDKFTAICEPILYTIWDPRYLTTLQACHGDSFTLYKQMMFVSHNKHTLDLHCLLQEITLSYVDNIRTSRDTPMRPTAYCGDSFTFLYIDYVRT
jgi:hypothetical protein